MQPDILNIRKIIEANQGVESSIQHLNRDTKRWRESAYGGTAAEKAKAAFHIDRNRRVLLTLHQASGKPFLYPEDLHGAGFPRLAGVMEQAVDEISPRDTRMLERPRVAIASLRDHSMTRKLPRFEYEGPTGKKQFRLLDRYLERERAIAAYDTRLARKNEYRLMQFRLAKLRQRLQWALENKNDELAKKLIAQGKRWASLPEAQPPNDFFLSKGVGKGTIPGQLKRPFIYSGGLLPVPLTRMPVTENLVANTVDLTRKGVDVGDNIFERGRLIGASQQLPSLTTFEEKQMILLRDFIEERRGPIADDVWDDLVEPFVRRGDKVDIKEMGRRTNMGTKVLRDRYLAIRDMDPDNLREAADDAVSNRLLRANEIMDEEFVPTPKDPEVLGGRKSDAGIRNRQQRTRIFVDPDTGQRHEIVEDVELDRVKKAGRAGAENRSRRAARLRLLRESQGSPEMLGFLKGAKDLATEDDLAFRVLVDREMRAGKNLRQAYTNAIGIVEQGRFKIDPQNINRRRLFPSRELLAEVAAREKGLLLDQRTLRAIRAGDTHSLGVPRKAVEALEHGSKIRKGMLKRIRSFSRVGGTLGIGLMLLSLFNQD